FSLKGSLRNCNLTACAFVPCVRVLQNPNLLLSRDRPEFLRLTAIARPPKKSRAPAFARWPKAKDMSFRGFPTISAYSASALFHAASWLVSLPRCFVLPPQSEARHAPTAVHV